MSETKRCPKCEEVLALTAFAFRCKATQKRAGYCKQCQKNYNGGYYQTHKSAIIDKVKEAYAKDPEPAKARAKRRRDEDPAYARAAWDKWERENPERVERMRRASTKVNNAVRTGVLIRPDHCSVCFAQGPVEGHHPDYDQPLKVEWLCRPCHVALHQKLRAVS